MMGVWPFLPEQCKIDFHFICLVMFVVWLKVGFSFFYENDTSCFHQVNYSQLAQLTPLIISVPLVHFRGRSTQANQTRTKLLLYHPDPEWIPYIDLVVGRCNVNQRSCQDQNDDACAIVDSTPIVPNTTSSHIRSWNFRNKDEQTGDFECS
jgi:hypothetical protein